MTHRTPRLDTALALSLLSVLLLLSGCGKAVGRLGFTAEGAQSAAVPLAAGDVDFWTDISLDFEQPAALSYHIELEQAGAVVARADCDPLGQLNIKIGWAESSFGNSRSLAGSGKMACSAHLPKAGLTNVRATLAFSTKPTTLTFKKADLVLKQ
ncbi:MAG TPA: hypothetical protein VEQ59_05300 [Polyangiaceae bacterium]|nr:hypothetical protein [Polyangiaceae bacterium]